MGYSGQSPSGYNARMQAPGKRRWFRFGLRTMFVVVTVLACWLGYELSWVRQRRAVLPGAMKSRSMSSRTGRPEKRPAPGLLWLFGEPGYVDVIVRFPYRVGGELTPAEESKLEHTEALFPEADVSYYIEPPPPLDRPSEEEFNVSQRPASPVRRPSAGRRLPIDPARFGETTA